MIILFIVMLMILLLIMVVSALSAAYYLFKGIAIIFAILFELIWDKKSGDTMALKDQF